MKRWIVEALETACEKTHWLSGIYGGCKLAELSDRLDQRWGTNVWKEGEAER